MLIEVQNSAGAHTEFGMRSGTTLVAWLFTQTLLL